MGTSDAADAFRPADAGAASQLSARDQEILAFERQWWKYAGAKEQAIRELFDMSATRYYQVLNALIDRPEALATRTRWPSTRCWSSACAGCARRASGPARPAASASRSDRFRPVRYPLRR